MMAATGAAAAAGIASLAAYLNGKYQIAQDLRVRRRKKRAVKWYADLGMYTFAFAQCSFHIHWIHI